MVRLMQQEKLRFSFGQNWKRYLRSFSPQRLEEASQSLREMLGLTTLTDQTFLDVGCGSGLFSLAAYQLGATVHSFDFDNDSVECAQKLREKYALDHSWNIERGSILDDAYVNRLGTYSIVYSWGVLHHTGNLKQAVANAASLVAPGGILFIAIYNDQGSTSHRWTKIKELYNAHSPLRPFLLAGSFMRLWGPSMAKDAAQGNPLKSWQHYLNERGMSPWSDLIDWVGGYPFEVAKPEVIFDWCSAQAFELIRLKTCAGGIGCNEFVFRKKS